MTREYQPISRSQFVLTYGPGSIIESKNGPRLIPKMSNGLGEFYNPSTFERFEVLDVRLCKYIQKNSQVENRCRILSLPSNAGLDRQQNYRVYSTQIFPTWRICYGRLEGRKHDPVLYNGPECPVCKSGVDSGAVRFVAACPDGHLDDVDWHYAVHKKRTCNQRYYLWNASGSSLANIEITCPDCGAKTNMQEIYKLKFRCSGRIPEKERPLSNNSPYYTTPLRPGNCSKDMRITQRQSTSLRMSETVTLLTIPKYDNTISRILQQSRVSSGLNMILDAPIEFEENDKEKFIKWIITGLTKNGVSKESLDIIVSEIHVAGIGNFLNLFKQLNSDERSFLDLIYEEYESLLSGAGRPTDNFVMDNFETVLTLPESIIPSLHVYPIRKIRTITVQTGYRRMVAHADKNDTKKVSTAVHLEQDFWYPGFEGFGEGLFITFGEGQFPKILDETAYKNWKDHDKTKIQDKTDWADICTLPEFVWLHTLSHALIRAVSEYTGYSAASLRERIYLSRDKKTGGILIYNTTPGQDGGMGGLTGIAKTFAPVVKTAEEIIKICSNDPLCYDLKKSAENLNGAACYSCLLISETSCEHRNLWLDRHLLLKTGD
ncbi:MAG: DUF1998 domain-containing protein [Methanoregula sp.]